MLQDVAAGRLSPSAVVLLLHYMQLAFAQHGKPIQETLRDTGAATNLGNGTILAAREALAASGWITVEVEGQRRHQVVTITLADRWDENCARHDGYGQKLTTYGQKPANGGRKLTIADLKSSPKTEDVEDKQQHAREEPPDRNDELNLTQFSVATMTPAEADDLVTAVYRGARRDRRQLTSSMHLRELAIARQLLSAGASPPEGEAWAREAAADPRRRAPIDMRAYEHERVDWLARRRSGALHVGVAHTTVYEHDPWHGRRPPIAEADLARGAAL
jgi:hypothetical protein